MLLLVYWMSFKSVYTCKGSYYFYFLVIHARTHAHPHVRARTCAFTLQSTEARDVLPLLQHAAATTLCYPVFLSFAKRKTLVVVVVACLVSRLPLFELTPLVLVVILVAASVVVIVRGNLCSEVQLLW